MAGQETEIALWEMEGWERQGYGDVFLVPHDKHPLIVVVGVVCLLVCMISPAVWHLMITTSVITVLSSTVYPTEWSFPVVGHLMIAKSIMTMLSITYYPTSLKQVYAHIIQSCTIFDKPTQGLFCTYTCHMSTMRFLARPNFPTIDVHHDTANSSSILQLHHPLPIFQEQGLVLLIPSQRMYGRNNK